MPALRPPSLLLLLGFQFQTWLSLWGPSPRGCQEIDVPNPTPGALRSPPRSSALSRALFSLPEGWREGQCNQISVRPRSLPANGLCFLFDSTLSASSLPAPFPSGAAREGAGLISEPRRGKNERFGDFLGAKML